MPDYSNTRIQVRRGTAAEFSAANPVLGAGEPAFETDTNVLKVGDGSTAYNSLSAISGGGGGGSEVNDLSSAVTWANVPDANITESSVVQHSGALQITESQIADFGTYLTAVADDTSPFLGGELNLDNNDIVIDCRNDSGSDILAGTPVYVSGYYANGKSLIAPADASSASTMPAIGIVNNTITNGGEGTVGIMGVSKGFSTNSFEVGDTVYIANGGGLTNVKPTGVSDRIQNLGRVLRKDASNGRIILLGAGRSNDVPNSATFTGDVEAASFTKTGGSSSEFLKADGSVDSSTYLTSVSNIDTTNFNAATIVTEAEGISSNDNDTTLPTSAAVKDYVDNNAGTTYTGGSGITISGTTINADLVSDPAGITGASGISNIVYMTQAAYTALGSYDTDTLYYIV